MKRKSCLVLILLLILILILLILWWLRHREEGGGPSGEGKVVFVTSQRFDGNFGGGQLTLGHLQADQRCQAAAESAGLAGNFKAWISGRVDTGAGPSHHGVVDRFTPSAEPYRLVGGTQVADDWADLTDGSLDHAIDRTETGASVAGDAVTRVWTNTRPDGTAWDNSRNCSPGPSPDVGIESTWSCGAPSWTAGDCRFESGKYGDATSTTGSWTGTESSNTACTHEYRLYCFEQ